MYVIHYRHHTMPSGRVITSGHLYEMSAAELKAASKNDSEDNYHERVSAWVAHDIVKSDRFPHSTALWVDQGRIRRA